MEKESTQLAKALAGVLNGFIESLSNPEVVELVVDRIAEKMRSDGCCPLLVAEPSGMESCPFTTLSIECFRRQGSVSEELSEKDLWLFNNPYLLGFMKISRAVTSTLDYHEVLSLIVKEVTHVFEAKGCTLMLLDKAGTEFESVAAYGLSQKYLEKGPIDAQRSIADTISGIPQQIYDVQNDPRVQYPAEAAEEGIGSILALPIKIRDRVIGNLRVFTEEKRKFHAGEVNYAMAIAEQCGIAIENALAYRKGKEKYKSLRDEVHSWMEYCGYKPE